MSVIVQHNSMSISTVYFFFAFCNTTFDFLLVRLWFGFSFEICLLGKIVALLFGLFRKKYYHLQMR